MSTFNLPDLGEGLQEAEIVEWHVAEGDTVAVDDKLVSVETAKAIVDVPSPVAGKILKLYAGVGDVAEVGKPLVDFEASAGAEAERSDAGTVVGNVESSDETLVEQASRSGGKSGGGGAKAVPAVRALARRLGVDLGVVSPSGPNGLITKTDVERVAKLLAESGELEPLRGPRRAMAHAMAQSRDEVVPATIMDDADIEHWPACTDVSARLIRAMVAGVAAEAALNVWYDGKSIGRRVQKKVDIAIAVDTEDGLFTPVLRNCAERDADDLRRGLEAMKAAVLARDIPPEEMRGYTLMLSNFGTIAGRYAAPVVVPPCVAILGAGVIRQQVVVAEGKPAVHRVMPLSLTFDHRAVTGGEAGRFLGAVLADLQRRD
jgi:pyruvate dehydrogenase E2 component (dihydrolipoamide acetyltransferase)